ncbi:unnamed protein product [Moneuplotes crassus]|uniref:Homeobox domain-containing protein n=1 Tax=Euplotes crassus TaxID=5936 RepID=A0AAD1XFK3_EUPCR|nr:unnamed protein product [Moneuplotes crassus]
MISDSFTSLNAFFNQEAFSQSNMNSELLQLDKKSCCPKKRVIKKISLDQVNILENMFQEDPTWSKKTIKKACDILGLPKRKVYKWGYDRKSKKVSFTTLSSIFHKDIQLNTKDCDLNLSLESCLAPIDYNSIVEDLVNSEYTKELKEQNLSHKNQIDSTYFSTEFGISPKRAPSDSPTGLFSFFQDEQYNLAEEFPLFNF